MVPAILFKDQVQKKEDHRTLKKYEKWKTKREKKLSSHIGTLKLKLEK